MNKLLGFLTGALLATAGMAYYFNSRPAAPPSEAPPAAPTVTLPVPEDAPPSVVQIPAADGPSGETADKAETAHASSALPPARPTPLTEPTQPSQMAQEPPQINPSDSSALSLDTDPLPPLGPEGSDGDPYWHIFWKPFTTRMSAQGFSRHIAQVSGIPITVIPKSSGQFVVAFSYGNAADLSQKLVQIEQHAKIKLSASEPSDG